MKWFRIGGVMGIGDDIMATAHARKVFESTGKRVRFVRLDGRPWNSGCMMWLGNPHIVGACERGSDIVDVVNAPGARPYIRDKDEQRFYWQTWDKAPGNIYLTPGERRLAKIYAGKIIISPLIKAKASPNKDWGWINWAKFANLASAAGIRLTQMGAYPDPIVFNAGHITTSDFRKACAVISKARAVVTHEGAVHHAAAAFGVPCITIFGGYISPEITGYDSQINLFTGGKACGMRFPCEHCRTAMNAIAPRAVLDHLKSLLDTKKELSNG